MSDSIRTGWLANLVCQLFPCSNASKLLISTKRIVGTLTLWAVLYALDTAIESDTAALTPERCDLTGVHFRRDPLQVRASKSQV